MTEVSPIHYYTPPEVVLQNRREFYLSNKDNAESIAQWFHRIRDSIKNCDFGALSDFLVIDKFICGLDTEDIRWIRKKDFWSIDQFVDAVIDKKLTDIETEQPTIIDNFLKVELGEFENDVSFIDTNDIGSDSEDNQHLSELKRQIEEKKIRSEDESTVFQNGHEIIETSLIVDEIEPSELKGQIKHSRKDEEFQFHCSDCGKRFKLKKTYAQHQRLHTATNLAKCEICSKVFQRPSKLRLHLRRHDLAQNLAGKSFECHLCKFQFIRMQGLRIHVNVKHVKYKKNDIQCSHCNGVFTKRIKLEEHLRVEHQSLKCPHCRQEFSLEQISELKKHILTHSEIKPFMCEVCGNSFKTRRQLQLHMVRHTEERKFKCAECGQLLKSRSNYRNHMRQHTGERPFKCDYEECPRTFVQRANYLKHLRWHRGEKPHGCSYCGKRFPTAYDTKLHVNSVHTGDKPFECNICNRRFSQPSTLRVHRMRVHRYREGIREVVVKEWFVKEGDVVVQFDNLCEVQSDKASVTITSRYDGKILKIHHGVDDIALVGKPLIYFDVTDDASTSNDGTSSEGTSSSDDEAKQAIKPDDNNDIKVLDSTKILTTPAVRRIAYENKVNLAEVKATGPNGRILKSDVLEYLNLIPPTNAKPLVEKQGIQSPAVELMRTADDRIEKLKDVRKIMFKSMTASLKIPHFTYSDEVNVTDLVQLRESLKCIATGQGVKLTFMPFFIKAASFALKKYPIINSSIDEENESIIYKSSHNISIAMATQSGLVVPNLKNCEQKTILQIARDLNDLQERGRSGKLRPDDFQNGTFSLSNIGVIGGTYTTPVIATPQVAIGAIGTTQTVPRFVGDSDKIQRVHLIHVSWSADHRVIDGVTMAGFSNEWKRYIENPNRFVLQ